MKFLRGTRDNRVRRRIQRQAVPCALAPSSPWLAHAVCERDKDAHLTRYGFAFRLRAMDLELTEDQKAFIRRAIEGGRFRGPEDAIREALSLWEERERRRAEILAAIDTAEASLGMGEGIPVTQESMRELAEDIKKRGRLRLDAEKRSSR